MNRCMQCGGQYTGERCARDHKTLARLANKIRKLEEKRDAINNQIVNLSAEYRVVYVVSER